MKVETFIRKYCERNKQPDFDYCPAILFYWNNKNGKVIYNTKTGVITEGGNNYIRLWDLKKDDDWVAESLTCRNYRVDGVYIKAIRNDIIEVSPISLLKTNRGKYGEKRTWNYSYNCNVGYEARVFIDKEGNPYDKNGNRLWTEYEGRYYNKELIVYLHSLFGQGVYYAKNSIYEFSKWSGVTECRGWHGRIDKFQYAFQIEKVVKKLRERPTSKVNHDFLSIKLPKNNYYFDSIEFHIINDTWSVFRMYKGVMVWNQILRKYISNGSRAKEIARVYVSNNGIVKVAQLNGYNEFEITNISFKNIYYVYTSSKKDIAAINFDNIYNLKCISWLREILSEIDNPYDTVDMIINSLRHPLVEKLYKSGYKNIANEVIRNGNIVADTKRYFYLNKLNEKSNIYKALKVNKYILKLIDAKMFISGSDTNNRWYRWTPEVLMKAMRQFNSMEDLSSLSKDTIEEQFDIFNNVTNNGNAHNWVNSVDPNCEYWYYVRTNETYSCTNELDENANRIFNRVMHIYKTDKDAIAIYKDTIDTYRSIINKPELNWDFRNAEELLQIHNNLIELKNIERRDVQAAYDKQRAKELEEQKKMFEKLQEKRIEDYECVGDDYEIRVPHDLVEITTEGTSLHHCVGGYLGRHAEGYTNIIFLRKKSAPSVPFYTIEVLPNGEVVQIHGKYNKWLGNDPEAISFVWKWINDRGLKCEEYKLLDTASGYSKSGKEVSRNYLTA